MLNFRSNFAPIFNDNSVKWVYFISIVLTCLIDENGPLVAPPLLSSGMWASQTSIHPQTLRQSSIAVARNAFMGHRVAAARFRSVVLPPSWCLLPQRANLHPSVLSNFRRQAATPPTEQHSPTIRNDEKSGTPAGSPLEAQLRIKVAGTRGQVGNPGCMAGAMRGQIQLRLMARTA